MVTNQYDCCRDAANYKKPAQLCTDLCPFEVLGLRCNQPKGSHAQLEGTATIIEHGRSTSVWNTNLPGLSCPSLCHAWARLLVEHAPSHGFHTTWGHLPELPLASLAHGCCSHGVGVHICAHLSTVMHMALGTCSSYLESRQQDACRQECTSKQQLLPARTT